MPEQKRYARDREKHRAIARKSYHANREDIKKRRKERYRLERAAKGIKVDPRTASRMAVMREAPRRVLQQSWTQNLFASMGAMIAEDASGRHARKTLRWAFRLILTHAEKSRLAQDRDITPAWLAGFPPQTADLRKEAIYRANFGRMLLRLKIWSQEDHQLFGQNLKVSFTQWGNRRHHSNAKQAHGTKPVPCPPDELRQLVRELAYRCGLTTAEMREVRVSDIQAHGLRIPAKPKPEKPSLVPKLGRLIPFGNGWDELSKAILDAWVRNEKPTDYLFFSRSPRDKKRPLSKITLNGALATLDTTITSLRNQHLDNDFNRARNLQEARFHLRHIHHLDNQYIHSVIAGSHSHEGYANEAVTIPIPMPYLFAAMCASRSLPEDQAKESIPESGGGKRHLITWNDLLGYEITVDWTRGFAKELGGRGQKSARTLRLLYRLAFDFWFAGRRMKLPDIERSEIRPEDKDLLQEVAATRVIMRNTADPRASWTGGLFEYDTRKRSFRIPLIEEMNRRAWHNQCMVCWHPERESIEREVSEASTVEGRKKGYSLIGDRYGVSTQSLAGHRGKKTPPQGRGQTQRSHFSTGSIAPILRCPRSFFEQLHKLFAMDLMIYSLVLLELHRADPLGLIDPPGLIVSTQLIEQRLALRLDESQLSVALNHLGSTGARLINFRRDPKGFYTELCDR